MGKKIFQIKDFSKISPKFFKKILLTICVIFLIIFSWISFQFYVPQNPASKETVIFKVEKGWGDSDIADNLKKLGIIRSSNFFEFYVVLSLKHFALQAGEYNLSANMSIHEIANMMAYGSIIKNNIVIPEGWDKNDISKYLQLKEFCKENELTNIIKNDYSAKFDFLNDKPKDLDLEGYLFPDTYEMAKGATCEDVLVAMLKNFDKKLTSELRSEIKKQKKNVFDIITMASMIEKEVITMEDKKIVSGILWKRMIVGMPLQIDATIVYITGNPKVSLNDTKIDSPYNTYAYYGLPKGPISNPGIDSIIAAIYPQQTKYFYYLTSGKTIFSETLEEHNKAKWEYLK